MLLWWDGVGLGGAEGGKEGHTLISLSGSGLYLSWVSCSGIL